MAFKPKPKSTATKLKNSSLSEKTQVFRDKYPTFKKDTFIPTGIIPMDLVLGGGLPENVMIEIASESGIGKTTSILHMCKNLCEEGHNVLYLDVEGGVKEGILKGIGLYNEVNTDDNPEGHFYLFKVSTFREAEEMLCTLIPTEEFTLVVIDSMSALLPDKLMDDDVSITDSLPALQARMTSLFLAKFTAFKNKYNVSFIFVSQMTTNLQGFLPTRESKGGSAMKFMCDIRLMLAKAVKNSILVEKRQTINGEEEIPVACEATIEAIKSRVVTPFVKVPITIVFGKGVSNIATYIKWLQSVYTSFEDKDIPVLEQSKTNKAIWTITLNGKQEKLMGINKVRDYIAQNDALIKEEFTKYNVQLLKPEDTSDIDATLDAETKLKEVSKSDDYQ